MQFRFGAAPKPAPRGAVMFSSFSFCSQAGIPQSKTLREEISSTSNMFHASELTPTCDGGWSFLKQAAFENFRIKSCP
ncbi:hypothetical protein L207DRAFT_515853 [Hyaloscypha variabilis F]|uniref:Uncharacterized protein n=1 Tax=Hyaloscypha variabilis (strain UAMH 11265 / GT02V1 / F) TaxID=1149755 RepID=A0A2J6RCA5_HYAVF|nr:hypothetical protein L207DRAFT_515853 [Hyaloscypha variabilis F]